MDIRSCRDHTYQAGDKIWLLEIIELVGYSDIMVLSFDCTGLPIPVVGFQFSESPNACNYHSRYFSLYFFSTSDDSVVVTAYAYPFLST